MGSDYPAHPPFGYGGKLLRLPSTPLFLGLLPAFSGQARLGDLSTAAQSSAPDSALMRPAAIRTFVAYRGPEAETKTSVRLLSGDDEQTRDLQTAIFRHFGPLGLKHLLGVFLAAEDAPTEGPGGFLLDLNRHLDRLGYKRTNAVAGRKYHTSRRLSEARGMVHLLCNLTLVQEIRLGPKRGTTIRIRMLLDEAESENWHEATANGEQLLERLRHQRRLYLRVNPHLYSLAIGGVQEQRAAYTYQLRQLVSENARQRPWVLILGTALPIRFGLNGGLAVRMEAASFAALGGAEADPNDLERIEQDLKYMVEKGYLGAFETERFRYATDERERLMAPPGRPFKPELTIKPCERKACGTDEVWQVEPPHFLPELLKVEPQTPSLPGTEREPSVWVPPSPRTVQPMLPGLEGAAERTHSGELLRLERERLGLSQGELARTLGYTQAAISMAEAGKRPKMAVKLLNAARQLKTS